MLIKTRKDCCNILIMASTCPLNPFTIEQSGFCYPHFLALRSQQYTIASSCWNYSKISTIRKTKEGELERQQILDSRVILTTPAPGKSILATTHEATAPITGTFQTTDAAGMPEHFPLTHIPLLRLQEMPARAQTGPFTALLNAISQGHNERGSTLVITLGDPQTPL